MDTVNTKIETDCPSTEEFRILFTVQEALSKDFI
jgi:hypothetical protein